jgi:hypothetical protein
MLPSSIGSSFGKGVLSVPVARDCGANKKTEPRRSHLEQLNLKKVGPLCKDLPANPCREMVAGELCPPLSNHLKAKLV